MRLIFSIILLWCCGTAIAAQPQQSESYWQASFTNATGQTEVVPLPHLWTKNPAIKESTTGSYRIELKGLDPKRVNTVLIPKVVMTAVVRINGVTIHEPDHLNEPLPRQWNKPIFAYIPASALRAINVLEIDVYSYPGFGLVSPIYSGPRSVLEPIYQQRVLLAQQLNIYFYIASLAVAFFGLVLGLSQRNRSSYLYFSLAALLWSFYNLNLFIEHIPVSAKTWWWWVHSCIDFWAVSVILFAHRYTGIHASRFEQAVISFGLAASAIYYVSDLAIFTNVANAIHLVSVLLLLYVTLCLLWQWRNTQQTNALQLAVCLLIVIAFAINDVYMNSPLAVGIIRPDDNFSWITRLYLAPIGEPIIWVFILWQMIRHYAQLRININDLQLNLETKISATAKTFEQEQLAAQQIQLAEVAASEKRTIYQNLYEDLSEKLSIIFHTASTPQQADAAKAALAELKDAAQTDKIAEAPLIDTIADLKRELFERCEAVALKVSWDTINPPPPELIGGNCASVLTRIIREATSNIIKHAQASEVHVHLRYFPDTLAININDNGIGLSTNNGVGRGINNMQRRAAEAGGSLSINGSANTGTSISLELPCEV